MEESIPTATATATATSNETNKVNTSTPTKTRCNLAIAKFDLTDDESIHSSTRRLKIAKHFSKYHTSAPSLQNNHQQSFNLPLDPINPPASPEPHLKDNLTAAKAAQLISEFASSSSSSVSTSIAFASPSLLDKDKDKTVNNATVRPTLVIPELDLARLARTILSRTCASNLPTELLSGNELVRKLIEVFTFPRPSPVWLWRPLFQALSITDPELSAKAMDKLVSPPAGAQPMSILTWLVQWRSLQRVFGWKAADEMVQMALAAGANPNLPVRNGSTAIFFAVKYGSPRTVELLLKHGADLSVRDKKGRSCLWNALERPQPQTIALLINQQNNNDNVLSPDELFPYIPPGRHQLAHQNAVDYLFAAQLSTAFDAANNPEYPWSWEILGAPSIEDVALSIIEFGIRGVTFTPEESTLSLVGFVMRGENPSQKKNQYPNYEQARERMEALAKLVVGLWLPKPAHQRIKVVSNQGSDEGKAQRSPEEGTEERDAEEREKIGSETSSLGDTVEDTEIIQTCGICTVDMSMVSDKTIRLYCGHEFCLNCILTYARGTKDDTATCPTCDGVLCLELTTSRKRRQQILSQSYGRWGAPKGPLFLTSNQIREECGRRNYNMLFRKDDRLRVLLDGELKRGAEDKNQAAQVELNINIPITDGRDINLVASKGGPSIVPIMVKGISVLAFLSTSSDFTTLSPEFVKMFGLKRKHLESRKFKNLLGVPLDVQVHLIEEFIVHVGEIEVKLRNALELSPFGNSWAGVQLGGDFFRSGTWCIVDVHTDEELRDGGTGCFITADGFGHTTVNAFAKQPQKEELRYYGREGGIFRTPLLHIQPFKCGSLTNWVNVARETSFQECNWCCLIFPEGMLACEECRDIGKSVYYCSKECWESAAPIHSSMHDTKRKITQRMSEAH